MLIDYFIDQLSATTGMPQAPSRQPTPWPCCNRTTGPATSDSCATTSSGMMILAAGEPRRRHHRRHAAAGNRHRWCRTTPGGSGGEKLMNLPLREAREVFEREYLRGADQPFGGNISRTAEFIGMERSALHRKLKSLSIDNPGSEPHVPHRLCQRPLYSPHARRLACTSRIAAYQFSDGVYEVCEVRGGKR